MLLKRYRIKAAKRDLEKALEALWMSSESVVLGRTVAMETLIYARRRADVSFSQLSCDEEARKEFYRLYLHRQYMAYLLEDVRQKQSRLRLLSGSPDKSEWSIGEAFSSPTAMAFNDQLFRDFLEESEPWLDSVEKKNF